MKNRLDADRLFSQYAQNGDVHIAIKPQAHGKPFRPKKGTTTDANFGTG
jgi:hypothetical protein